jgi:DNA-binding Xre family transcriptional regulator
MTTLKEMLAERGSTYGDFAELATVAQDLKNVLTNDEMNAVQRECMELICTKLARIVTGNPNYADNWLDIAGYAQLAVDDINRRAN